MRFFFSCPGIGTNPLFGTAVDDSVVSILFFPFLVAEARTLLPRNRKGPKLYYGIFSCFPLVKYPVVVVARKSRPSRPIPVTLHRQEFLLSCVLNISNNYSPCQACEGAQ